MSDIPLPANPDSNIAPTTEWTASSEAAIEAASIFSASSASSMPSSLSSRPISSSGSITSPTFSGADYVEQPHFHRNLTIPATDSHGELNVTYAVAGSQEENVPTMLFLGGMFGGRYLAVFPDYIGMKLGVKVIVVDRPGMGGSTPVEANQRISVWLETVPILLDELKVKHVALAAHSCGVIYAFNTIYHLPHILSPTQPTLYLFTPWVHCEHSGAKLMSAASVLPSGLINQFDSLVSLINTRFMPPISFSSTVVSAFTAPLAKVGQMLRPGAAATDEEEKKRTAAKKEKVAQTYYGVSAKEYAARTSAIMPHVFKEDTSGANGEALLALRKKSANSWGVCDDYREFVPRLDEQMKRAFWKTGNTATSSNEGNQLGQDHPTKPRLRIKAFFAEEDIMIGKGGERYFDACFQGFRKNSTTEPTMADDDRCIQYISKSIHGTDHEDICMLQSGVLSGVLKDVCRIFKDETSGRTGGTDEL